MSQKIEESKKSLSHCLEILNEKVQKLKEGDRGIAKEESLDMAEDLQAEVNEVLSILGSFGQDFTSIFERSRQREHTVNKLKLDLRNQNDLMDALEQENQNLLDQSEVDRSKLTEILRENEEFHEKFEKMEIEFQQKNEELEKAKVEAESEQEKIDIKLKAAEKKNKWLWTTIEKFKVEKKKLKARIKELEAEKKEAMMAIEQSELAIKQASMEALEVNPAPIVMQSEIIETNQEKEATQVLEEKLKSKEEEIESLNKRIGDLKKSLAAIGKQDEDKAEEIEDLRIQLEESEAVELTSNLKFEYFQEKLNNKEHEIAELERVVEMERSRYSTIETKFKDMEVKYKKAKAEATKQLLMPRVSIIKARGKDFMRKSTIPTKRMGNQPGDKDDPNNEVVVRGRANTIFKDLTKATPTLADMVLTQIQEKSENVTPQKAPPADIEEKGEEEETPVKETETQLPGILQGQGNFEIKEVTEEQNPSLEDIASKQDPGSSGQKRISNPKFLNSKLPLLTPKSITIE